jgi:hypothetical protein
VIALLKPALKAGQTIVDVIQLRAVAVDFRLDPIVAFLQDV